MTARRGGNRDPSPSDAAAELEATAISNGNLERAGEVAAFRSKRLFQRVFDFLVLAGCALIALIWVIGLLICAAVMFLPPNYDWLSPDHEKALRGYVAGGLLTSFASNYIKSKLSKD